MSKIKKNIKSLKGFTLLELIVVIAIISVLLMIIVPNMTDYIRTSRIREANDRAQQIYVATQDYLNSLQTRGAKVEDYFGAVPSGGTACKFGIDSNSKDVTINDLRILGSSEASGSSVITPGTVKWDEAAKGILSGLSEDFAGSWYVEIYPATYTVKFALYSEQKNDCSTCTTNFDWDAVRAVSKNPYKSMFTESNTDTLSPESIDGRTMRIAKSQETCYNKGYETAYVGQYPIPAPTA